MKKVALCLVLLLLCISACAAGEDSGLWEYADLEDGSIQVTHYRGDAADVVIPSEIDGRTVTSIGSSCCNYDSNLRSVTIPDTVTDIAASAFHDTNLKEITIPGSVKRIEEWAFNHCRSLSKVTLSEGLEYIGDGAFNSTALKQITIPAGVTRIGEDAFSGCESLSSVVLSEGLKEIGKCAFYHDVKLKQITIPASVVSIGQSAFSSSPITGNIVIRSGTIYGDSAFWKTKITSATIEEGVLSLPEYMFGECDALEKVTLPESLTEIGDYVFSGCKKLQLSRLPEGIRKIGKGAFESSGLSGTVTVRRNTTYGGGPFERSKVTEVIVEEGVTKIDERLFFSCDKITKISLSSTLEEVGDSAFYGHKAKKLVIPASVRIIGDRAFQTDGSCNVDLTQNMSATYTGQNWFGKSSITYAVGSTSEKMLLGQKKAKAAPIPKDVTTTPADAILENPGYTVDDKVYHLAIPEGVGEISDGAFTGLKTLRTVTFPSTLKKIGAEAFKDCENLEAVILPDSVTELGTSCFSGCAGVKKLRLSAGLTEIPMSCFGANTSLTKLVLPEGVLYVNAYAFYNDYALKEVVLPDTLLYIGDGAFAFHEDLISLGLSAGKSIASLRKLSIPASVEYIADGAFFGQDALTSVTFDKNSSLKLIGAQAFGLMYRLKTLDLSGCTELVGIDENAFAGMWDLKTLKLPPQEIVFGEDVLQQTTKVNVHVTKDSAADIWVKQKYPKLKVTYLKQK